MPADSVKIRIFGDASQFNKEVQSLGDRVKNAAAGAGSVLKGMLASQIITRGVSMLTSGIRSAINTGMEFEAAMSQVAAISGASAEEMERLTAAARHYGETTKFTASQAAEALNYMALAGWDVSQSLDALPGVLSLAAASGMELGAASDAVTDYLSAFGMEASQATYMSDLMAYAQANANTSATQLADAYGNCASSMHAAGQDIETTTAMLMALSNQGVKGSEAGTQMAAVMRDLTQKMENGRIMIGRTAVQVVDAAGNFRDLNDIMADIGAAVEGMGTAESSAAIMTTFTARSVKAVQTILNEGLDNVDAYEQALRDSEGTAADQSATMLDNLQGDIQIFQSALEGLQITASDSFSGVARSIVQEGTSILEEITRGGKANGLSGMVDSVIGMIPELLSKASDGIEALLGGIAGKLPAIVKKLVGQLPNLLKSGLNLAPTLVKAVTDAAGSAVESLAANLPEFVESIFEGLPGILESVFNGAVSIVGGLFRGLDSAMGKLGLRDLRFGEIIQRQLDSIDPELKKELQIAASVDYTVEEVTITAEDVQAKVDSALETFRAALIEAGIDEETAAAITQAVQKGSGYDAFVAALEAWGVPEDKATEVAESVQKAFGVFQSTFTGLGLDESAQSAISEALASGADVEELKEMLISYGVDPEEAAAAAGKLKSANDTANIALQGVGINDGGAVLRFSIAAGIEGSLMESAINSLSLSGVDPDSITESYNTIKTSVGAGFEGVVAALHSSLTNGIPDEYDADFAKAKEDIQAYCTAAQGVIDEWEKEQIAAAEQEYSGVTLEEKIAEIKREAETMRSTVQSVVDDTEAWANDAAGKPAEYVNSQIEVLNGLIEEVYGIDAKMRELDASVISVNKADRLAVEGGYITDPSKQMAAIAYTNYEYQQTIAANHDALEKARAELAAEFANDPAAYAAAVQELEAQYAEYDLQAMDLYNKHMQAIAEGMIKGNPELIAAINRYKDDQPVLDTLSDYMEQINALGDTSQLDYDLATMGIDKFAETYAEQLGLLPERITEAAETIPEGQLNIGNLLFGALALENGMDLSALGGIFETGIGNLVASGGELYQSATEAFDGVDWGTILQVWSTAAENGLLQNADQYDLTDADQLFDYLMRELVPGHIEAPAPEVDMEEPVTVNRPEVDTSEYENAVTEGINSVQPECSVDVSPVAPTSEEVARALGPFQSEMSNAGANGGDAFDTALAGKRSQIVETARQIGVAAAAALKAALQIGSPSKVMMRLGEFTGEGFEIGLRESIGSAVRAAQSIAGVANIAPKLDFSGITGALSGSVQSIADIENERPINLYVNGKRVGQALRRDNASASNQYNRSIALGVGK